MHISSHNWSLVIDLNGGRIQELTHSGIKVFGTYQRADGKIGNTHICAPSFDKEGQEIYSLPFHGYARTLTWNSKQLTTNTVQIQTVTPSTQEYPAQLVLIQTFVLEKFFTHKVEVKNIQGSAVPVNIGIHYYWDTPKGWNSIKINNELQASGIQTNGHMKLREDNIISFPHAVFHLRSQGFRSAALWTSFKTLEDSKQYSQDFCCIEPIVEWPGYFGSDESKLKLGETKVVSISIGAGERT